MNSDLKFIVVDYDGVLTSKHSTPGSYLTNDPPGYGITPACLKVLLCICALTGARILISSNWRKMDDWGRYEKISGVYENKLSEMRKALKQFYYCDLPREQHMTKSQVLDLWFEYQGIDFRKIKFVIFDDDPIEGFGDSKFAEHFIQTNPETGLTPSEFSKALKMLT